MLRQQNSIISSIDTHTFSALAQPPPASNDDDGGEQAGGGVLAPAPSHVEDLVSKELASSLSSLSSSLSSSYTLFTPTEHMRAEAADDCMHLKICLCLTLA